MDGRPNPELTAYAKKWWLPRTLILFLWCLGLTLLGLAFLAFGALGVEPANEMVFPGAFAMCIGLVFLSLMFNELFFRINRVEFVASERCLYLSRFLRGKLRLAFANVRGYSACGYVGMGGQSNGVILYSLDNEHYQLVDDVLVNLDPIAELIRKSGVPYLGEEQTPFPILGRHRFNPK